MESNRTHSDEHAFRVIVAIDFSTAGDSAIARGVSIANTHPTGEVHLVSVAEPEPLGRPLPPDAAARLQEMATYAASRLEKSGELAHLRRIATHLLKGSPAREIVRLAAQIDADVIVVGTHGRRGVQRLLLGSVAEEVLRSAGCTVLVERARNHPTKWKTPEVSARSQAAQEVGS